MARQDIVIRGSSTFERLEFLIESAREAEVPVIWTQMTESKDNSPEPIAYKIKQDQHNNGLVIDCEPGTEAYEFFGDVKPLINEKVIPKNHYDSFSNPDLDKILRGLGVSSVVLVGGFATRCVLATAFGANTHDYHVLTVGDAVINPAEYESEMSVGKGIINAILGFHAPTNQVVENWLT